MLPVPKDISIAKAIRCIPGVPFIADATNRICDRYAAPDDTLRTVLFLMLARAQDGHLQLGTSTGAFASVISQLREWSEQLRSDDRCPSDQEVQAAEWLDALAGVWPAPMDHPFPENLIVATESGLQLRRFHHIEVGLETAITNRLGGNPDVEQAVWDSSVAEAITYMAEKNGIQLAAEQQAAVASASRKLLIITGGPGTGKTTVIASILDSWKRFAAKTRSEVRVALAAPTARAATRITSALSRQHVDAAAAMTVHRLLGSRPDQHNAYFYNERNPLEVDVLIIDEVSMLDAGLMDALLRAMPPEACLILVGDPNQLPSVEAGSVLQDLMALQSDLGDLNPIVTLMRNQRATTDLSAISETALAGDASATRKLLGARLRNEVASHGGLRNMDEMQRRYAQFRPKMAIPMRFTSTFELLDAAPALFRDLSAWQIICPLRRQVQVINKQFVSMASKDDITPIIVTRNNYALDLMNGEIGFSAWVGDELYAAFEPLLTTTKDGNLVVGATRLLPYASLTDIDTAYAITVHKSQGSEWGTVDVVLPPEANRLCTRELLYTAVTRARKDISVLGSQAVFDAAISTKVFRDSNLGNRLTVALRKLAM
ncbi:MAG: ATP-dependent RecD-like DNA helicase [Armatimonadota bacterium]